MSRKSEQGLSSLYLILQDLLDDSVPAQATYGICAFLRSGASNRRVACYIHIHTMLSGMSACRCSISWHSAACQSQTQLLSLLARTLSESQMGDACLQLAFTVKECRLPSVASCARS